MLSFSELLKEERIRLGLTQDEISKKCGVAKRSYINYEKGENSPNIDFLMAFSEIGGDVMYLLFQKRNIDVIEATEQLIVNAFRQMSDRQKLEAIAFMSGLSNGNISSGVTQSAKGDVTNMVAGNQTNK